MVLRFGTESLHHETNRLVTNGYGKDTNVAEHYSKPFCYGCYEAAPSGRCERCGSDDLMRFVPGVGVEYGLDWVAAHLVSEQLTSVDIDKAFEESVSESYPETVKIGWIDYDVASAIKSLDPISWDLAKSERIDAEVSEDVFVTFDSGSTYFRVADVEQMSDDFAPET